MIPGFGKFRAVVLLGLAVVAMMAAGAGQAADTSRTVAVIERTDIELSGLTNLRELLLGREFYNSFGLHRPLVLGTGRAAFLVDGRPVSGLDLTMFPLSAVERIEIRDEGAARHGGHAIAGTVDIVLRSDYDGAEISAGAARPTQPGGDSESGGAVWGGALGRGHVVIGVDHAQRQEIRDADRDYSRAKWTPGGSFADTQGVSIGGNTLFIAPTDGTDAIARSFGACDENVYTGVLTHTAGEGCGFAYADIKWQGDDPNTDYVRRRRDGLFLNADHPLGDDAEVYVDARVAQGETAFRYAPSTGPFDFTPSDDLRERLIADVPELNSGNFPDDLRVYHRFVGHGNRDWRTELTEHDLTAGLRGAVGGGLGYDAHLRYWRRDSVEKGDTFVSETRIRDAIERGDYDLENPLSTAPRHLEAIRATGLRLTHDTEEERLAARATLNGAALALPGGEIRWTAGVEFADQDWRDIYDYRDSENRFHEATDVLGTASNSSVGQRQRWSALAEASIPLHDGWDATLAGRRDDYDDVGEAFAWRAASRYRVNDSLAFRASWDKGARAPNLSDMHRLESLSYPVIADPLRPGSASFQVESVSRGNPSLKPDDAESVSIGAAASFGPFSLGVDWFAIELSDLPAQMSAQSIVDLDAAGNLPAGARVIREGGLITEIVNPVVQTGETEVAGVELRAGAAWETGLADLAFDVRALRTTRHEERVASLRQAGDYPRDRVHASLRVSRDGVTARWSLHAVSGYRNDNDSGRYEAWMGHDFAVRWRGAFGVERLNVAGGVLNIGNEGPSTDSAGLYDPALTLDSVLGRTIFVNAALSFGG